MLVPGGAHPALAGEVAAELGCGIAEVTCARFPDGEVHIAVPARVRGCDVYLVQPTGPPPDEHLFELLMLADAARRAGAARVTAIVPYLAYARQDRRSTAGEAIGLRVVAGLVAAVHIDRLLVVDPHTPGLEAVFGIPVEAVTAVPLLASRLLDEVPPDGVVVAPDLGAVKLAERFAALLRLPVAVVRKTRHSGTSVKATGVVGDVRGRTPVIVDDMISTAATIEAAVTALLDAGSRSEVVAAATHGLLVGPALGRLRALGLRRLLLTDSLPLPHQEGGPLEVCPIAALLADAVSRLHRDEPLDELSLFG